MVLTTQSLGNAAINRGVKHTELTIQISGIEPMKLLLNKSNGLNCSEEEVTMSFLNPYEWVVRLDKKLQ